MSAGYADPHLPRGRAGAPTLGVPPLALLLACLSMAPARAAAQRPMGVRVELGADVPADGPAGEIFRVWRSYLARWPAERRPNAYWSPYEQERTVHFDLVGALTYGSPAFRAEYHGIVLGITPDDSLSTGAPRRYVIRTLFASERGRRANVVTHVYAVRDGGRWVLSNAFEQRTRGWRSTVVGPITYVYPPTHAFDTARAARGVRFLDSLSAVLDAGRVGRLVYVLGGEPDDMMTLFGLEQTPHRFGGRAFTRQRLIISGSPAEGEAHLHELAHFVLAQILDPASNNRLAVEGAASWAAGRADGSLPDLVRRLRRELERRPTLALREVLGDGNPFGHPAFYPLGAVLCQMAFERGGVADVKRLLRSGPSYEDLLRTVARVLRVAPGGVDEAWRTYVLGYAPP